MKNANPVVRLAIAALLLMGVSSVAFGRSANFGPLPPPPVEEVIYLKFGPLPPPPVEDVIYLKFGPLPPPPVEDVIY